MRSRVKGHLSLYMAYLPGEDGENVDDEAAGVTPSEV